MSEIHSKKGGSRSQVEKVVWGGEFFPKWKVVLGGNHVQGNPVTRFLSEFEMPSGNVVWGGEFFLGNPVTRFLLS